MVEQLETRSRNHLFVVCGSDVIGREECLVIVSARCNHRVSCVYKTLLFGFEVNFIYPEYIKYLSLGNSHVGNASRKRNETTILMDFIHLYPLNVIIFFVFNIFIF